MNNNFTSCKSVLSLSRRPCTLLLLGKGKKIQTKHLVQQDFMHALPMATQKFIRSHMQHILRINLIAFRFVLNWSLIPLWRQTPPPTSKETLGKQSHCFFPPTLEQLV